MKWNGIGRLAKAFVASAALGLGMTACGGGTIGYLWVLGQSSTSGQGYQIAAFKIDDFSGNLTRVPTSPFTSGGTNPVQIVVRAGGRYVYVVNKGDITNGTAGNIQSFSVGGDGILTPQESYISQGQTPVWAATDTAGAFLYVLDNVNQSAPVGSPVHGVGDITGYRIAADTGRLTLVTNQQVKDPTTNINLNYFPVGLNPTMLQVTGGGCVFTLDSGDQTIFPYQAASGQLNLTTSGPIAAGTVNATSITLSDTSGSTVYLTDASSAAHPNGQILPFKLGTTACALNSVVGGAVDNLNPAQNPVWTLTEARNKKFLYVANQSSADANFANSSISVFSIDSGTGKLQVVGGTENPLPTGSGPVCLVEDPTNQYVYSSNLDGTVTGFKINQGTGLLQGLQRGSTFKALTHLSCMAVTGAVN